MPSATPAGTGDALPDIDTPALIVDLDAFEQNLHAMARMAHAAGVRLRPHAKSHKSADIARRQLALGAVGVCCQKVSEAEALVDAGIPDVLVSNEVIDPRKLERFARLASRAHVGICVDSVEGVRRLAAAAGGNSAIDVLVEIDVGGNRCGVEPGDAALTLARTIADAGLHFGGLHAYHGRAQHFRPWTDRRDAIASASLHAAQTRALLEAHGFVVDVITGGGTGTYPFELASGVYSELQAGSYIFMDADYGRNLDEAGEPRSPFRQSLFVLAQVMSAPGRGHAIVDAGLKAFSFDSGPPLVHEHPDVIYERASDEHGMLKLGGAETRFRLGEKVKLVPGHCDPTVALYDWIVACRGDRVEELWRVHARGAVS